MWLFNQFEYGAEGLVVVNNNIAQQADGRRFGDKGLGQFLRQPYFLLRQRQGGFTVLYPFDAQQDFVGTPGLRRFNKPGEKRAFAVFHKQGFQAFQRGLFPKIMLQDELAFDAKGRYEFSYFEVSRQSKAFELIDR